MYSSFLGKCVIWIALLCIQTDIVRSSNVIYCYWGTWSHYRTENGQFQVSNIEPNLCTHIGYAFFGLGYDYRIKSLDTWLDYDLGNINKTVALKQRNPNLKVMASIGGWNEGSARYSAMAGDANKRSTFIQSVIQFVRKNGFDGCDLDWLYPVQRGGSPADKVNYVTLLSELNTALKAHGLLLTIAVAAGQVSASISYDIPNLSQHVDLINVMTYDFAGVWSRVTSFNAPLQGSDSNNVKAAIGYWLESGAPAHKIVLGFTSYGRSFFLNDSSENTPGSPVSGPAPAGPFTQEAGVLGYFEICQNILSGSTRRWDVDHLAPYAFRGNYWVGFDDTESYARKIDYLKSLNLAGAMMWSIETDDFRGNCGETFPLLRTLNNGLNSGGSSEPPTADPSTTVATSTTTASTTVATSTTTAPNIDSCQNNGYFANPTDCSRFYQCHAGFCYDLSCPANLHYDKSLCICNWPKFGGCLSRSNFNFWYTLV